jgi:hypothetical protein
MNKANKAASLIEAQSIATRINTQFGRSLVVVPNVQGDEILFAVGVAFSSVTGKYLLACEGKTPENLVAWLEGYEIAADTITGLSAKEDAEKSRESDYDFPGDAEEFDFVDDDVFDDIFGLMESDFAFGEPSIAPPHLKIEDEFISVSVTETPQSRETFIERVVQTLYLIF